MVIWNGPRSLPMLTAADIEYDGDMLFTSNGYNWELALLSGSAASLRFLRNPGFVDLFLVAGGESASYYSGDSQNAYRGPSHGGPGGKGGECVTVEGVKLEKETDYIVSIGGSDQNTTITMGNTSYTARPGFGADGGDGATITSDGVIPPEDGDDGYFAYGKETDTLLFTEAEFAGHRFGPGGSGGGAHMGANSTWSGGALGGESNGDQHQYGKGGRYVPGYPASANGSEGNANHGQGGGGPAYWWTGSASRYGDGTADALGKGGSGVLLIRGHRQDASAGTS